MKMLLHAFTIKTGMPTFRNKKTGLVSWKRGAKWEGCPLP